MISILHLEEMSGFQVQAQRLVF